MKRRVAFEGWLLVVPVLVLGGWLARRVLPASGNVERPLAYAFGPLRRAWEYDLDGPLLATLAIQLGLLLLLGAFFGAVLLRLAAVELATRAGEGRGAAQRFALRRTWRLAFARVAAALVVLVPLGAFLALGPRSVLAAIPLGVVLLVALAVTLAASGLPGPAIAVEDAGAGRALRRAFALGRAAFGRAAGLRLAFGMAALLRTALAVLPKAALALALAFAAGALAPSAGRAALAVAAAWVVLTALAELSSRLASLRVALFLHLREAADGVAPDVLAPPPADPRHRGPEAAGFERVATL